jgi:RNA polymerase sigma-70 factor, ECF subfamily
MRFPAVFMIEGRRVVAGEAVLDGAATTDRTRDDGESQFQHGKVRRGEAGRGEDAAAAQVETLVREHSRLVYRIAYAVLRSHHDAEDAAQETFLRVLRYNAKLAGVEDTKTWLARIAWRVAVDRSRQRGAKREIALDGPEKLFAEPASAESPADVSVHGTQVGAVLEKLIAALPEKLRQPLVLATIEEMSPREVAAALGTNEAAVRSRVFRARQILREKLGQRLEQKFGPRGSGKQVES